MTAPVTMQELLERLDQHAQVFDSKIGDSGKHVVILLEDDFTGGDRAAFLKVAGFELVLRDGGVRARTFTLKRTRVAAFIDALDAWEVVDRVRDA